MADYATFMAEHGSRDIGNLSREKSSELFSILSRASSARCRVAGPSAAHRENVRCNTIEFICQGCGADIVTSEDVDDVPLCVICRDTRQLENEAKPAGLDDGGVRHGLRHPLRRARR
jgi:hypothetical protein